MCSRKRILLVFFGILVLAACVYYFTCYRDLVLVVRPTNMEPSIKSGAIIKAYRRKINIQRGNIVVYDHDGAYFTSRVIGLPGERVAIFEKGVIIGDNMISYENLPKIAEIKKSSGFSGIVTIDSKCYWQLAKDEYFLIGDNYKNSYDSRNFGPIKKKKVIGIVKEIINS